MKSLMTRPLRGPLVIPPAVVLGAVAVVVGLALASVLQREAPINVGGAVAALAFCLGFFARPDLGVLLTLFARSSTDLGLQYARSGSVMASLLNPNILLILILIFAGVVYIMSRRVRWLSLPGGTLLTLMLVMGLFGMLRAENVLFSFREWLPVVAAFVVYALSAHFFRSPEQVRRVIDVIALSFILPAAYGFWQLAGHETFVLEGHLVRVIGTFIHPNPFSFYLVIIITLFTCQFLTSSGPRRLVSLAIVAAACVLLVGTLTRIAWVGAVIALLAVGAYRSRMLLVLVPLAVVFVAVISPATVSRVGDPLGDTRASGLEDRFDLWRQSYQFWLDATTETNSSIATMMNRIGGLGPGAVLSLTARYAGAQFSAHNDYIRVLDEYGIFGLCVYSLLVIVMLVFATRTVRAAVRTPTAAVPLAFFAVTLAFTIMSVTDNVFGATQNQVYYWALAGMTAAIGQTLSVKDKAARAGNQPPLLAGARRSSRAVARATGI